MQLLYFSTTYAFLVLILSIAALSLTSTFCNQMNDLILPSSPKATLELKQVFLPPIKSMQAFVIIFDIFAALHKVYLWPLWDGIKRKFPYF